MTSGVQMILALLIGVGLLIYLILKTKIHAFPALIISASAIGLIGGLGPAQTIEAISSGFGGTLGSIGIVIGLGVMMGKLLEISGGAEQMAASFLKTVGKGREEWALGLTGAAVSIPVFCDSGFVILIGLAKSLSKKTGRSIVVLGISLAAGLVATHHTVPPTPGPLAVAGIYGADIGQMILVGLILACFILVGTILYAKTLAKKIKIDVDDLIEQADQKFDESELPAPGLSFSPIAVPIFLILLNTLFSAFEVENSLASVVTFLGNPAIAVMIGLLIAIYGLVSKLETAEITEQLEKSLASAAVIIFVTGAGGALGSVLRASGIGDFVAEQVAEFSIPMLLIPFVIATLVRLVQGSGTVAMITAASITAPIVANSSLNPVIAAQATTVGAMIFSYFNDSFFWVVTKFLGLDVKQGIRAWSMTTTVAWLSGLVGLVIINIFI
jgi:GntP family gluconate:H+ symporter